MNGIHVNGYNQCANKSQSPELKPLRDRAGPVLDPSRQMGNGPATAPSDLKGP